MNIDRTEEYSHSDNVTESLSTFDWEGDKRFQRGVRQNALDCTYRFRVCVWESSEQKRSPVC